jgi:hypothetical protein
MISDLLFSFPFPQEHRRRCTELNNSKNKKEEEINLAIVNDRDKFFEKMKALNKDLQRREKQLEELSKKELKVIYAYITFNKAADRDTAYRAYNEISIYQWFFHSKNLYMKEKYLKVKNAREPSVIIWENLQYTKKDRFKRRFGLTFASLLLIFVSVIMIFSSKYLEEKSKNNGYSATTVCPADWGAMNVLDKQTYVELNPAYLHCYCDQFDAIEQAKDEHCREYLKKTVDSQVLTYFASFIVLLINFLITSFLKYSLKFEKHHTSDGQGLSIFYRLFILKYINTAGVFLINNNNVILRQVLNLHVSSAPSFTSNWYSSVGVTIILVQLGDIFNAHADVAYKFWKHWRQKRRAVNTPEDALTQEDLNKKFVGPEFDFAFNYAQMLSTFFVTLTFSTGIPLLYPIAAANFIIFYFSEKYLFIYLYKIPPHFNTVVGRKVSDLIPVALLVHIGMSIWMLSNKSIFTNEITGDESANDDGMGYYSSSASGEAIHYDAEQRVTEKATLPLFVLFFVILALWLLTYLSSFLKHQLERVSFSCFSLYFHFSNCFFHLFSGLHFLFRLLPLQFPHCRH